MKVRYFLDAETCQPHIYNYNVADPEVEEVLANSGEDRPAEKGLGSRSVVHLAVACSVSVPDPEPQSVFS